MKVSRDYVREEHAAQEATIPRLIRQRDTARLRLIIEREESAERRLAMGLSLRKWRKYCAAPVSLSCSQEDGESDKADVDRYDGAWAGHQGQEIP